MAADAGARVRAGRERTAAEHTARIRAVVLEPGADIGASPMVESIGTVDFMSRNVALETPLSEMSSGLVANLAGTHDLRGFESERQTQQAIFIGDEVYDLGAHERWLRGKVEWYRRPLWSLDALQAAGPDWTEGDADEIHGMRATSLSGSIERNRLKRIDPHWHKVWGAAVKTISSSVFGSTTLSVPFGSRGRCRAVG